MTKQQKPDLTDQDRPSREDKLSKLDKEINSLVIKFMTYLKVAEAQKKHPISFNSLDFFLKKVGKGSFCDVFKCRDKTTRKEVAVKIFKDTCKKEDIEREVSMLEEISLGNPFSKFNVKFLKQCEHDGRTCLVFERLWLDFLVHTPGRGLYLHTIRAVAIQLFLALDELKALNILHADIHPGNVMYVNNKKQPVYVKLIDFGMAIKASDVQPGMTIQTFEYRAPEIFLGLPFTEAIDVWGVGCTLAFLYLGYGLFSASSEHHMVERIVELLGQPEDHLLRSGKYTERFFMEDEAADGPTWRLRNPGKQNDSSERLSCLDDLVHIRKINSDREYEDKMAFVDLLKQLLHVDANQRISARQALKHPFITMDHLISHFEPDGSYHFKSNQVLEDCPALSEYLKDQSENWTPSQGFPVVTTHWDQEGRIILRGSSSNYTVLLKIGQGVYNYVLRCQNNTTKEEVAVKIPMHEDEPTNSELAIMKEINARNPASNYIIKFLDQCEYRGRTCLVFEMLDGTLIDDLYNHGKMTLRSIRPIAKQLFLVLDELKALNIQHNDIHEGNVMFVNKQDQPHRIKLIDFGSASKDKEDHTHPLGFPKPVYICTDMSDVGCVLAAVYLEKSVYAENFKFEIELGLCEEIEYKESERESESAETVSQMSENNSTDQLSCLENVVHVNSTESDAEPEDLMADEELEDRKAFADLLKQMMHYDVNQRISPCQALQHPFITMDHLINRFETSDYLDASQAIMNECPVLSTDTVKSSSDCQLDQKSSGSPDGVAVTTSEAAKPTDFTPDVAASSGDFCRKLLQRIQSPVKTSDGKIPTIPDKDNSEACLSGGGLRQSFNDEDLTARSSEGVNPTDIKPGISASSGDFCRKLLQRIQSPVKTSDGKIPTIPDKDNSEACLSGGGLRQSFNDEDLTARSSEGVNPTDIKPGISASSGDFCRKLLQRIQSPVKTSDGKIPTIPDKDNSEACLSGGGLRQSFNDEDLTARSSEGVNPTDIKPGISASSGGLRKLLQRIQRFFRRVKKSNGKIPIVPDENDPDVCPSNGEIPPVSDKDNPEACVSGGGLPQCFNNEDLTIRSSEGAKPTDFTPHVSASSGGFRKLLKRISKVKNYLCCCLHPDVED